MVIATCAVISGADDWADVELFGRSKEAWLRAFLPLRHGIPSEDTFRRVFRLLDPKAFERCFRDWVEGTAVRTRGQVVPIDGKTLLRSHNHFPGYEAIQMVSAWASANGVVLGQLKVAEGSNEIPAIPQLLRLLAVSGCIVTVDAIGCQREVAEAVVAQGADYVLAVKGNQPELERALEEWFRYAEGQGWREVAHDVHRTLSKGHGRIEIRLCWTIEGPDYLDDVRQYADWSGVRTIVKVHTWRWIGQKREEKTRYSITSLGKNARKVLHAVRSHWAIENQLHWRLDVTFREDESRLRKAYGAENFSVLRQIALNLLQQEHSYKGSIKRKRLKAALDENNLWRVLGG